MNVSCASKERGEISIEVSLEILGQHRLGRCDRWGRGAREIRPKLVEVNAHETERAAFPEHRQENVGVVLCSCLGEKDLPVLAGVMQPVERLALELASQLRR